MTNNNCSPKISIITICFNSEKYIEETILSYINQSYENKEYIIIDGGSTDGTLDIINCYKNEINFFISEPDNGISDAFNKGIKAATGDIIGIINSDDKLATDSLLKLAQVYDKNIDVYRGDCMLWNSQTKHICIQKPMMKFNKRPLKMSVCHPSTFISKTVYEKYGLYDMEFKYGMDFDLLMRLYVQGASFFYLPSVLAYFRLGGVSQNNDDKRLEELKQILKKNGSNKYDVCLFEYLYRFRLFIRNIISYFGEDMRFFLIGKSIKE